MFDTAVEQPARAAGAADSAGQRRFEAVRRDSEGLAANLSPEDQAIQSMPDASPTKWHLAHTTWFFETFILGRSIRAIAPFDPAFAYLFNSYYEAVGPRHPRPQRGLLSRPTVDAIGAYRDHVTAAMLRLIDTAGDAGVARVAPLIELGLHHEQQHQELILTDIKHVFSVNPLLPAYQAPRPYAVAAARRRRASWVEFAGGLCEIGHDGAGFAFDNEGPRHKVWLEPFRLASQPVTCGEYLAFIDDGGYAGRSSGCRTAGRRVQQQGWQAPLYWRSDDGEWRIFTLPASGRSSRPSRSAMSASTRPTPSPAGPASACRPRPNGRVAAADAAARRQSGRQRPLPSLRRRRPGGDGRIAADDRRRLGMDRQPLRRLSALSRRPPARSANTTASSCPTRWCCAAARRDAGRPRAHHLSQLLPARGALGVFGAAARGGYLRNE